MAILYKGYAQQKGFGSYLVDVPDPSKKIRQQGLEAMGHMKDAIDWNNKQASRLTEAFTDNANLESKVAKENFELGQDMNQMIHNQKMRNWDDRINADKAKKAHREKQIQSLLSLTKSGAQLWKAYDTSQKKAGSDYANMLWEEHGIGWKKLNAVQNLSEEIWHDSSAREAELTKLGMQGYSEDLLQRIRSVSGYKKIAIAKADARRWAKRRSEYYSSNWNTKVEIPGFGEADLDSARGDQVDTVLQLLDKRARDELGVNAPTSKIMASSGSYTLLEEARSTIRQQKKSLAISDALGEKNNDELLIIDDHIAIAPDGTRNVGAGIVKAIEYYAGPNPSADDYRRAKKRVFSALQSGIKDGYWDASIFAKAGDHEFKHSSGKVSIRKIFKNEWLAVEDALVNGTNREYNVANIAVKQNKVDDQKYLGEIMNISGNLKAEDYTRMLSVARKNNWSNSQTFISNQLTRMQNNAADDQVLGIVQDRINSNRHMTRQEVIELGGSPAANSQAFQLLDANSKFLPESYGHEAELDSTIEALLESRIPTPVTGTQDYTRATAKTHALTLARSQYKAYMTKPGANPQDAKAHALQYIKERIFEKGGAFEKEYDKETGNWGFSIGMISGNADHLEMDATVVATKVQKDRGAIYNEPLMSVDALRVKSENLNKGIQQELLPRSVFIESTSKGVVNALETEQAQIAYYNKKLKEEGKPLIREYPEWYVKSVKDLYSNVNPSVIRLLNKYDYCKINQAACTSGMNPVYTKPAFDKARNIVRGTLGTNQAGDYNATENGSSLDRADLKNVYITGANLKQITELQQKGLLVTAGRYQFTAEQLIEAANLAGIPLTERFDADTQNKLFDAYFKQHGPEMINNIQNLEDQQLLKDLHESVTSDKISSLKFNSPRTLSVAAYKELNRRGYFNNVA